MPVSLTTELSAVNTMLSIIGEAPVNSVENTGVVDAVIAKQILDEVNREVQSAGWSWNTDHTVTLQPSFPLPGDIYLPANTMQVDPVDTTLDYIQRGNRLYDRRNQTFKFDGPVIVDIMRLLPFDEIPQPARYYITVRAGRIFQDRVVGSETLGGFNREDEVRALARLKSHETETADYSFKTDCGVVRDVIGRRWGGYRY